MENTGKQQKIIGILLIAGAVALLIPYTILTVIFDYPGILREDTAEILSRFHEGGTQLILTWFAFAISGVPLIPAFILLGQRLETKASLVRLATSLGVISLIVQMIGLLRWTFVVPVLADTFVNAMDEPTRAAAVVAFKTIHQFAGVILGEHLGQLLTVSWTIMMSISFSKLRILPTWINWFGITSAVIYFLAQAELIATVIPDFLVWEMAGFLGSTLWLIWLIIVGVQFTRLKNITV